MNHNARLQRLVKRLQDHQPEHPHLTLFLVECSPDHPVGIRSLWNGVAREICFDPANGAPELPPGGPHKIILGAGVEV
jgi:hypothetical protein